MVATGGGVMAFVASISGLSAATDHAAYGAAKAGLISLVKSAATELGPLGIRVNAVAPGVTMTPRISLRLSEEEKEARRSREPLRRLNEPTDIARALLFFASDLSRGVTGQTLAVDGGSSITFPYAR
jgi:NAD(P)-dependent dehydrogenase (short-subunit alcohol dehydrogenase family)